MRNRCRLASNMLRKPSARLPNSMCTICHWIIFRCCPTRLYAVTAEQAQAAAQKYIQLDKITVLAVGDRAKIEADMKKLNLGKMEIRDHGREATSLDCRDLRFHHCACA